VSLITGKRRILIRVKTRTRELAVHINLTENAASNNSSAPGRTMKELDRRCGHALTCSPPHPGS
jgi:hypothetical protein